MQKAHEKTKQNHHKSKIIQRKNNKIVRVVCLPYLHYFVKLIIEI